MKMKPLINIKKYFAAFLLCLIAVVTVLPAKTAYAFDDEDALWDEYSMPSSRQKERLYDQANLLSYDEQQDILKKLDAISEKHQCNFAILTVDSHTGPIQDFADDYFDYNGFQADYNGTGILFMLSMEDREYAFSTCGNGIGAFTDYGQEKIIGEIGQYLGNDDYYTAFNKYISLCDTYFSYYEDGNAVDVGVSVRSSSDIFKAGIVCLIIGMVIALIVVGIMAAQLKSVHANSSATGYQDHNGIILDVHRDTFIRANTTRTRRVENESSGRSGGGSSVHISSSGSSHGGSHGHF